MKKNNTNEYTQFIYPGFYYKAEFKTEQTWKRIQEAHKGHNNHSILYIGYINHKYIEDPFTDQYIVSMTPMDYPVDYVGSCKTISMDVIPNRENIAKALGYTNKMTTKEYTERMAETIARHKEAK